jgi:20S proteasome subunit beta 7
MHCRRAVAGSYGTMARYRNLNRLRSAGPTAIIGGSGDYSDFQSVMQTIDQLV